MSNHKLSTLAILLVLILVATGCASNNIPQTGDNTPAATFTQVVLPTEPAAPAETSAPAANSATAETGGASAPEATAAPTGTGGALPGTSSQPGSPGGLVVAIDPQNSEARYRVREQLANRDLPNDAIGRTKEISGAIVIQPDGTIDAANSKIVVNLASLQTDQSRRDNFVRQNVLMTDQFPNATFVPTGVSGLSWPLPQSGPVTFQLTGDLTIRDVTKPVTWNVTGNIQDGQNAQASGTATTSFKFEDFNLPQPRVPMVLSIADNIGLEVDVALQPSEQ